MLALSTLAFMIMCTTRLDPLRSPSHAAHSFSPNLHNAQAAESANAGVSVPDVQAVCSTLQLALVPLEDGWSSGQAGLTDAQVRNFHPAVVCPVYHATITCACGLSWWPRLMCVNK
jgi:hypothetical protein